MLLTDEERREKSYELRWLEAEIELAILEHENFVRLHKQLEKEE